MRHSFLYVVPMVLAVVAAAAVAAQVLTEDGPVVYGHHHLNTTNMDAQKKFYVETLGGKADEDRRQRAGDHRVPERADVLPADAGADGRLDRHDGATTSASRCRT